MKPLQYPSFLELEDAKNQARAWMRIMTRLVMDAPTGDLRDTQGFLDCGVFELERVTVARLNEAFNRYIRDVRLLTDEAQRQINALATAKQDACGCVRFAPDASEGVGATQQTVPHADSSCGVLEGEANQAEETPLRVEYYRERIDASKLPRRQYAELVDLAERAEAAESRLREALQNVNSAGREEA